MEQGRDVNTAKEEGAENDHLLCILTGDLLVVAGGGRMSKSVGMNVLSPGRYSSVVLPLLLFQRSTTFEGMSSIAKGVE